MATASGTLTNVGDTVAVVPGGSDLSVISTISGQFDAATVVFEFSTDSGVTWKPFPTMPNGGGQPVQAAQLANMADANWYYVADLSASLLTINDYRVRLVSAPGSGTVSVSLVTKTWNPLPSDLHVAPGSVTGVLLNQASAAQSAGGTSSVFNAGAYKYLMFQVSVTALTGGTSPTLVVTLQTLGADGVWYNVLAGASINAASVQFNPVGPGLNSTSNTTFGNLCRLSWAFTGAPTSITFSLSVLGKN